MGGNRDRSLKKLTRANGIALAVLALGLTILGADKSPVTRMLLRCLSQNPAAAVTSNDVARGWREVGTEGGGIVPAPAGAVTNEPLRRRGGFDWAFRVAPEGLRVPWRGGFLDGVTVLARGEVRPDIGTLYYPVPITNGVSLLPEARWGLLPHGGASVFWHGRTDERSLLLTWENALVGRDPNCPTNLQMELYCDGSFAWRTDDESRFYLPVFPFDWDGDGLENSVDPEPLDANPVDAHGTNAEWYGIVCSNVFENVDGAVSFKPDVNTNAYYFAEVVAEEGPAPIYFNADRDFNVLLSVIEPTSVFVRGTPTYNDFGLGHNSAGGVGMGLELYLMPTNVVFSGIAVQEVPTDYHDPWGYFANPERTSWSLSHFRRIGNNLPSIPMELCELTNCQTGFKEGPTLSFS